MKLAVEGKIENFNWKNVNALKIKLQAFMPDEKFFNTMIDLTTDTDEDEDDNVKKRIHKIDLRYSESARTSGYDSASRSSNLSNRRHEIDDAIKQLMEISPVKDHLKNIPKTQLNKTPKKYEESIAAYSIKTSRLPPASLFAKPSEIKEPVIFIKNPFEINSEAATQISKEEAERKLNKIRENINQRLFEMPYTEEAFGIMKKRTLSIVPCKTLKNRRNSVHAEVISTKNLQKSRMKRRQSCFVKRSPEKTNENVGFRCAIKRTRANSLYKLPSKGNQIDQITEMKVNQVFPNRHVMERARKEINDSDLEKQLPKPDYYNFDVDVEFKKLLDLVPLQN